MLILVFHLLFTSFNLVPNFGHALPQKLNRTSIFLQLMYNILICIIFLLSNHSLNLIEEFFPLFIKSVPLLVDGVK